MISGTAPISGGVRFVVGTRSPHWHVVRNAKAAPAVRNDEANRMERPARLWARVWQRGAVRTALLVDADAVRALPLTRSGRAWGRAARRHHARGGPKSRGASERLDVAPGSD
jgi:hypothetical protein